MTITTTSIKAVALGNNATTTWPFTFLIPALGDIIVTLVTIADGTETVVSQADYTVTGLGVAAGGSVEYPLVGSPITTATKIVVERFMPEVQNTDLTNQGGAYPADIEDALDYLTMICQQLQDQIDRAIVFSVADEVETTLPVAEARANLFLAFDADGNPTAVDTITAGTTVSAAMIPVVTAATLALARTAFGFGDVALLDIGAGLRDDGSGNLAVNSAIVSVSGSTAVGVAQDLTRYVLSAAMTFTAVRVNTLWNGYGVWIDAVGGDATFTVNAADTISGITASSWTIPKGMTCFMKTNGVDTWYPEMFGVPTVKQITGSYTITAADNFKILCHASGTAGTIAFPAGNTLPPAFRCYIYNGESTAIGKVVTGINLGTFILYPSQGYSVLNIANTISLITNIERWKLPSSTTFYVDPAGSNSNDGLSTGASRAFLTIQHGIDVICNYVDINRQTTVLQIANGTWSESLHLYNTTGWGTIGGHAELCIRGNLVTPASCILSVNNTNCFSMVGVTTPWRIEGFKMISAGSPGNGISCDGGSFVYIGKNDFGVCANAHISSSYFSFAEAVADYSITGGAAYHMDSFTSSLIDIDSVQITLTGVPAFSAQFAAAFSLSNISAQVVSFVGTATGSRYVATGNANINVGGGGANYFPGNAVGSVSAGGQYS